MTEQGQLEFDRRPAEAVGRDIKSLVLAALNARKPPGAFELVQSIEQALGLKARWDIPWALATMREDKDLPRSHREYLDALLESGDLGRALRGEGAPDQEILSSIDLLFQRSKRYRDSKAFPEMIQFMARFKEYAPFNNLLVSLQNPACSFYATEKHWRKEFGCTLKEDARPLLILAPKHPVMLVYDLEQVEDPPTPEELERFAKFEGKFEEKTLGLAVENAAQHYRIKVDFKTLSSTGAGFATFARGGGDWKMRIAIHDGLDAPSRFGVLCHELAHIFLGHLGSDRDRWWPARWNIDRHSAEIEAEATAFVVTSRIGLEGASPAYVSRHFKEDKVPGGVSLENIAKAAGRIEEMTRGKLGARQPKSATVPKKR